jgi:hypothetical protein
MEHEYRHHLARRTDLMLVGVLPVWPHASSWGYGPSGIVGVLLIVIIVLFLMGRL